MADFTLDTSGYITVPHQFASGAVSRRDLYWTDLSPFAQGYVEALFASLGYPFRKGVGIHTGERPCRFSDLAPETLAAILKDCAEMVSRPFGTKDITNLRPIHEAGARFWANRQERRYDAFPPLTPFLDDEGKVRLREAG